MLRKAAASSWSWDAVDMWLYSGTGWVWFKWAVFGTCTMFRRCPLAARRAHARRTGGWRHNRWRVLRHALSELRGLLRLPCLRRFPWYAVVFHAATAPVDAAAHVWAYHTATSTIHRVQRGLAGRGVHDLGPRLHPLRIKELRVTVRAVLHAAFAQCDVVHAVRVRRCQITTRLLRRVAPTPPVVIGATGAHGLCARGHAQVGLVELATTHGGKLPLLHAGKGGVLPVWLP